MPAAVAVETLRDRLHTSVSSVKTYLLCPRKFELQYVRGVPPAFVPINLAFGSAFHAAAATHFAFVKETGAPASIDEILSVFRDAWENAADGPVPLQADDEDSSFDPIDKGVAMLRVFHAAMAVRPLPQVVAVEKGFAIDLVTPDTGELLDERLVGAFDLVTREGPYHVITEIKTAARRYSNDQLAFDHQLSAYHLAGVQLGMAPVALRYLVVTKARQPAVQIEDVQRGPRDVDDFLRAAVGVLRAIDAGAFWPNRGWQCPGCSYAHACTGNHP